MKRTNNGFLLIEVLVSIVIFSTGIMASLWAFRSAIVIVARSADYFIAMNAAEETFVDARFAKDMGDSLPRQGDIVRGGQKTPFTYLLEQEDISLQATTDTMSAEERPEICTLHTIRIVKGQEEFFALPFISRDTQGGMHGE